MRNLKAFCLLPFLVVTAAAQNGIFADFTTSMGDFSCKLEQGAAPKAVANFIGLATGERPWTDTSGQVWQKPYFDGLTFHRTIKDFMIQGGSQDGSGGDGPGFVFQDEFGSSLLFNEFGMLGMANSGSDRNGAQFFVTVAPTMWLNNKHTIFGRLVSGSNVVYAISRVATTNSDKPLTNVVIQKVTIRRVGTDAQKFNIQNQGLPIVTNVPVAIASAQNHVSLTFSNRAFTEHRLYSTGTFTNWGIEQVGVENATPITNRLELGTNASRFYRLVRAQYPNSTTTRTPRSLLGRKLVFGINRGPIITNTFDLNGTGTYAYGTNSGTILEYSWTQEPFHHGTLYVVYSGLVDMEPRFDFTSVKSGEFTGRAYTPIFPETISGLFYIE